MEKIKKYKIIFISIFLFFVILTEFFYREIIYKESIQFEKVIQIKMKNWITFFKIFTHLGYIGGLLSLTIIIYLIFPLTYSYSFLFCLIFCLYLSNILKMIYNSGRPYLEDESLFQSCEGGFGNPSGHSFCSTACFLAFVQEILDFKKHSLPFKILLFSFSIILIILISFSRLILGVHSLNQVVYGNFLGFIAYYIVFQILYLHKVEAKTFFKNFLNKKRTIFFTTLFIELIFLIVFVNLLFHQEESIRISQYKENLLFLCPNIKKYKIFEIEAIFGCLIIFAAIGMFYGLLLLVYLLKNDFSTKYEFINNYFHNTNNWYIKFICLLISFSPMFIYLIIPSSFNIYFIYILKMSLPMFLSCFQIFGLNIYFCIKYKGANALIYEDIIPMNNTINRGETELSQIEQKNNIKSDSDEDRVLLKIGHI